MTKHPKPTRKEKKSEMLDVRLPYGMKKSLVDACRKQGVTVSDTVRGLISEYIATAEAGDPEPALKGIAMKISKNPRKTFGMTLTSMLAAIFLVAQPSLADDRIFESFDENADGVITMEEINEDVVRALDRNGNKTIELNEFETETEFESVNDIVRQVSDTIDERELRVSYTKIKLTEGHADVGIWSVSDTIPVDANEEEVKDFIAKMKLMMKDHANSTPHDQLTPPTPPAPPRGS